MNDNLYIFDFDEYDALNESVSKEKLENLLSHNIVSFAFHKTLKKGQFKKDYRFAVGTLNMDFIPKSQVVPKPKGGTSPTEYGLIVYWDLVKKGWRCLRPENIINIFKTYEHYKDYLRDKNKMIKK